MEIFLFPSVYDNISQSDLIITDLLYGILFNCTACSSFQYTCYVFAGLQK